MGNKTQKIVVLCAIGAIALVGGFFLFNNTNTHTNIEQFDQQENRGVQETQQMNTPETTMQNQNQKTQNTKVQQEESAENTPKQETAPEDRATVKPNSISLQFSGQGFGYPYQGTFKDIAGDIELANNQFAKAVFRVNARSVDAGNFIVNSQLKGEDFLNVNDYPEITLRITNVEFTEGANANASAQVTIRGVTHLFEFPATITISSFTADFTVDVSQYGITHPNVDKNVHMRISSEWTTPE